MYEVQGGELYLTKSYGIVVGLGSCVEVHSLFDIIMTLIVSGQVVRRCSVTCVVGYFRCLMKKQSHLWMRMIIFQLKLSGLELDFQLICM